MPKKPANLQLAGGRSTRQSIWEAIRKGGQTFTCRRVAAASGIVKPTVAKYLRRLELGGYIEGFPRAGQKDEKQYRLTRDIGVEAPRLDANGGIDKGWLAKENMWRTMRIMGQFSPRELAMHASTPDVQIGEATAVTFAFYLHRAGYLQKFGDSSRASVRGRPCRYYRLIQGRYTGPRPPMIQRAKTVYDPNEDAIVWMEEPDRDAC